VNLLETSGDGSTGVSASVHDVLAGVVLSVVEQGLDTGLSEAPGTGVERLLLAPNDGLGVGVLVEVLLELLPREGVELLNASDGDVVQVVLGSVLVKGSPDLTAAENNTLNLFRSLDSTSLVLGIGNNPLEASVLTSELLDVAASQRVTEKRLGEEDNEGCRQVSTNRKQITSILLTLAVLAVHLAAENMKQVGRRCHVGDLHVAVLVLTDKLLTSGEITGILVAELKVSLEASRRVLGTLTIITVGQRHDETGSLHPLDLTRSDKLVNDTLSVVGEVTELGLPHDKGVGRGQGVTILKAEGTKLTQGRVRDDELALVLAQVLKGSVGILSLLVVEDSVSLREGTTLDILTGDTDVVTLSDERTKCQSLSSREVDVLTLDNRLGSIGENTLQVAVNVEALGSASNNGTDMLESSALDTCLVSSQNLGGQFLGRLEAVPSRGGPLLGGRSVVLGLGEALLEHAPDPLLVLVDIRLGERALLDELIDIDVDLRLLLSDALVHERLGEGRLIGLVVAVLSVAVEVNDNIVLELGAPIGSKLADKVDSLDVVGVNVENGSVDGLGNIGTVGGRSGESRIGGETNLVVHDEVNGTAGREGGERVEAETLVDDTLSSKGGITVEKDTHGGAVSLLIVVVVLDSAGLAQDDGILSLKMRRVGDQRKLNTLAGGSGTLEVHTEMVLDVTRSLILGTICTSKLAENRLVGLSDDVGENVETATMRHTDDNVLDTIIDTAVNEGLHTRDKGLTTLKTESLVVRVLGSQERLEAGTPDKSVENTALLIDRVLEGSRDLKAFTEPVALITVRDMNELNTERTAVDSLASIDNLAESHLLTAITLEARQDTRAEGVLSIHVLLGETIVLESQFLGLDVGEALGVVGTSDTEGINLGGMVTARLVSADKKLDLQMVGDIGTILHGQVASKARNATGHVRDQVRRRLESLRDGHLAALHVLEVDLPRNVDALRILPPLHVHLIDVASGASGEEVIVRVGRRRSRAGRIVATSSNGQRAAGGSELP
jgi:hypothetical protein